MYTGKMINKAKANRAVIRFNAFAPKSEEILAIFKVSSTSVRSLLITKRRILGVARTPDTEGNVVFTKELFGANIKSVTFKEGKRGFFHDIVLSSKVIINTAEEELEIKVHNDEVVKLAEMVESIIGAELPNSILPSQSADLVRQEKVAEQHREELRRAAELSQASARKTTVKTFTGFSRGVAEKKAQRYAQRHNLRIVSTTKAVNGVLTVVYES